MEYNFREREAYWQQRWEQDGVYRVSNESERPKYYVLDMFPYPSGAGLHVGHPLGYIASDIFSRYKRQKGFNVLHPMGFDAFGLPAEQYAIETGQHPATTTYKNIETFKGQFNNIGFGYDWSREVKTCDPSYYKWTQWIFLQLFDSWFNLASNKAERLATLIAAFEEGGSTAVDAFHASRKSFSADEWKAFSEKEQQKVLGDYRLAYQGESDVWYCPALGTVLANDEVKDGVSERGGHPVFKKTLRQWFLRITAYAERLLADLEPLGWSDSLKEMQKNWIGKSIGASIHFQIEGHDKSFEIFTTRPDTIFGVSFMVLAPEHKLVAEITTDDRKAEIEEYLNYVNKRSERERMSEVKVVTGAFTGAYAKHPFSGEQVPIWIGEYVLASYGTGAIMAVPSDDDRDHAFATKYEIPIIDIIDKSEHPGATRDDKVGKMINSDFLNGMEVKDAIAETIRRLEEKGIGTGKTNYKLRDAGFSRQRYWGEPFPIVYRSKEEDEPPYPIAESELPLTLPDVETYKPNAEGGKGPLAQVSEWVNLPDGGIRETDTMPGYAGSSWYFLRYMDPHNDNAFVGQDAVNYWDSVDLYVGGTEHAVGHLMYSRMWHKFFYDMGWVPSNEPFKKLINQGMIQGVIEYIYLKKEKTNGKSHFICARLVSESEMDSIARIPIYVKFVENYGSVDSYLSVNSLKQFMEWRPEYKDAIFECGKGIFEGGQFSPKGDGESSHLFTESETGKMSKSKFNTINPDDVIAKYGADCFRMYEMFLGPIEQSKPWNTKGIDGVNKFLKKFWFLFSGQEGFSLSEDEATEAELKVLHKTIKKVGGDIENFSFNTAVSAFMVCVNELSKLKCNKRAILEPLTILLASFAPHITEEIWHLMGKEKSIHFEDFPEFDEKYLVEASKEYPISINGKMRTKMVMPTQMDAAEAEQMVMADEVVQKWLEGKEVKKFIFVPGRIVNIAVAG